MIVLIEEIYINISKSKYFNCSYNTTCNFIKTLINIYFTYSEKGQRNYTYFEYVKYRNQIYL
jgi:hypothetical protein